MLGLCTYAFYILINVAKLSFIEKVQFTLLQTMYESACFSHILGIVACDSKNLAFAVMLLLKLIIYPGV
jgi:hypothetical protein